MRDFTIKVTSCKRNWQNINISVFKKDYLLREHVADHVIEESIEKPVWQLLFKTEQGVLKQIDDDFKKIRCPGGECQICYKCNPRKYQLCGEIIAHIEKLYIDAIIEILKNCLNNPPDHIHYKGFGKQDLLEYLVTVNKINETFAISVYSSKTDNKSFNVMSAYPFQKKGNLLNYKDSIESIRRQIQKEKGKSVEFCLK